MHEKFKTEIDSRDVTIWVSPSQELQAVDFVVEWIFDVQFNSKWIRSVACYVAGVTGKIVDENENVIISDFTEFEIQDNMDYKNGRPEELQVDLDDKTIFVS